MPRNEKKFRIFSLLLILAIVAVLSLALFAPTSAIEFDPGGNYKKILQLPDADAEVIVIRTIQIWLNMFGIFALAMIIFGGMRLIMSRGNEEKVKGAKEMIKWAVIGMVVVMLSWAIVTFVFSRLGG